MRAAVGAGLLIAALVAGFVQVQQRLLRWRAERLLADIRQIQMGKSTWADAQRLITKWGAWGGYEEGCTSEFCDYQIVLQDSFQGIPTFFTPTGDPRTPGRERSESLYHMYRWFGGRSAFVAARFIVKRGIVWGKDFSLNVEVSPDENSGGYRYLLTASASTVSQFPTLSSSLERVLTNPEYQIGRPGACEGCLSVYARFTPFADSKLVDATLADLQLNCLTRHRPCIEEGDVMPETWKALHTAGPAPVGPGVIESCGFPMELLGRDNRYVAIAQVVSNHWTVEYGGRQRWTAFRMERQLKGKPFGQASKNGYSPVADGLVNASGKERTSLLQTGRLFILTFDNRFEVRDGGSLDISRCGIIPLIQREFPRLCRGGSRTLRIPGVCFLSKCLCYGSEDSSSRLLLLFLLLLRTVAKRPL